MFCEGGLFACSVCDAFEGATPDECPGERMSYEDSQKIYEGQLNFRDGEWRTECCEVMRPVHDLDNYMRENGYVCKGERWVGVATVAAGAQQYAMLDAAIAADPHDVGVVYRTLPKLVKDESAGQAEGSSTGCLSSPSQAVQSVQSNDHLA